jgi:iron complex transport system permease protein
MSNSLKIAGGILISLLFLLLSVSLGSAYIPFGEIIRVLGAKIHGGVPADVPRQVVSIIWEIRLPRAILAFLTGGCVSAAGAVTQSLLKNPLASPYTMGISAGVALGAGLIIISGATFTVLGAFTLPLVGFLSGIVTVAAVMGLSTVLDRSFSDNTIILFGMVFSLFANAVLTALSALFTETLKRVVLWQMGSFALKGWSYVGLLLPFAVVGLAGVLFTTRELDLLTFGDDYARSAGVEVGRIKKLLFFLTATLTGGAVALSGVIGFVDLVAPHIARRLVGGKHRFVTPMSFLAGGSLMVVSDLAARSLAPPSEVPVGAITALVGAPFFVVIYFSGRKKGR